MLSISTNPAQGKDIPSPLPPQSRAQHVTTKALTGLWQMGVSKMVGPYRQHRYSSKQVTANPGFSPTPPLLSDPHQSQFLVFSRDRALVLSRTKMNRTASTQEQPVPAPCTTPDPSQPCWRWVQSEQHRPDVDHKMIWQNHLWPRVQLQLIWRQKESQSTH